MIILELNTTPATEEDVAIWRRVTPGRAGGLGILAHSCALKADRIDAKLMAIRERARRHHLPESSRRRI